MCDDEIEWRDRPTAEMIDWMPRANDVRAEQRVVQAARVSSGTDVRAGAAHGLTNPDLGLLRMLARDRHGSPFEHAVFTWHIETPLFVAREFFRHRIASYNETSGRYRVLEPVFYVPPRDRPLKQTGKPGAYTFEQGTDDQYSATVDAHHSIAECAWHDYKDMLSNGVAKEVARNVLPLSLYTSFYVTMNLRAFFNFTSLRWAHPDAEVPTFPLWEIEQVAKIMELHVTALAPVIMRNFNTAGRRPV